MPNSIITLLRYLSGGLLLLFLAVGCRQDETILPSVPALPGGADAKISLTLRIPGFQEVNTRAGVQEEMIREITVLMLADEGGIEKIKVKHIIPAGSFRTPPGAPANTVMFNIPVTAGMYKRIALVANASGELAAAGIDVGSTYDALKGAEAAGKFGPKGGTAPDSYIPMYGEYAPAGGLVLKAGVSQTIAQELSLIRMLARVDVINATTSGATLNGISYINPVGNGRIYVDPAGYNAGYMAPTLPGTLQKAGGGHTLEGTPAASGGTATYYLCEQPVDSSPLSRYTVSRPCILVRMQWNRHEYYYRFDYTWDGVKGGGTAPYTKGAYMPILRNHRYIFTISAVKGPGFTTEEEALKSPENHTNRNIVVTPIVIDDSFTDVVYNNMGHFLAVSRTRMTLHGKHDNASIENKFSVCTNYPGGWKAGAYNTDGTAINSWLKPSQNSGATGATLTNPVTEGVQAITNGRGFKAGYIEVRAGRLYTRVDVEQVGTPLDYVAEYNLAGGSAYGYSFNNSEPQGYSPTSAQTAPQLRWATSHGHDQSGYYNWYVLNGIHHATNNPNTKNLFDDDFFKPGHPGHGYHLPSMWELIAIFSFNSAKYITGIDSYVPNVNEACEFGGIKKTFASDYFASSLTRTGYALRFKAATGNPNDGYSSLADFPKATDNKMLCVYRYTLLDAVPMLEKNNYSSDIKTRLKIDCIYLGEAGASITLNTINNNAWWSARASQTVTRIFPVTGDVRHDWNRLFGKTSNFAAYWSSTIIRNMPWFGYFSFNSGGVSNNNDGSRGYNARLFADE